MLFLNHTDCFICANKYIQVTFDPAQFELRTFAEKVFADFCTNSWRIFFVRFFVQNLKSCSLWCEGLFINTKCRVMVPISDGNSEIGAHVRSAVGNLICWRHLFRSTRFIKFIFRTNLFSFARAQHVLSYHLI